MYIKTDAWYVFQNSDMHIDTIGMWTIINNGPNARICILYKIIGEKIRNRKWLLEMFKYSLKEEIWNKVNSLKGCIDFLF